MIPEVTSRIKFDYQSVSTSDDCCLAVQTTGEGPPVLIANGIGVSYPGMSLIVEHLMARFRVILWDYRGIRASRVPPGIDDFSMERHGRDAIRILDALGIERAAYLGWSMGVPVGIEAIRHAPERIAAFGALFGAAGRPFRSGMPDPVAAVVEGVFSLARRVPVLAQGPLELAVALPSVAFGVLSTLRFVGPHAHRELFESNVAGVKDADKRAYLATMEALAHHDGHDLLPSIRCPSLVVAGTNDWLTPPSAAEAMARALPDARLVIIDGATHFGVIEDMPALLGPIDDLLASFEG